MPLRKFFLQRRILRGAPTIRPMLKGASESDMNIPQFEPMTLTRIAAPFDHPDFIFEIKVDGFRALAYISARTCALILNGLAASRARSLPIVSELTTHAELSSTFPNTDTCERRSRAARLSEIIFDACSACLVCASALQASAQPRRACLPLSGAGSRQELWRLPR
jgi:hypothetical protein